MNARVFFLIGVLALVASLAITSISGQPGDGAKQTPARLVTAAPTTLPATIAAGNPLLPDEYSILQTRNVFHNGGGAAGPGSSGGPDAQLVFRGSVQAGSTPIAFIEDMAAKKVLEEAVGDSIGQGRIKSIDLDSVEYAEAGGSRRIQVGQNLDGIEVPPPAPPAQPNPPAGPATQPADQ